MQQPATKSIDHLIVPLILFCGVVLRMVWLIHVCGSPVGFVNAGEATLVAQALADGRGFADAFYPGSGPTAHLSPLVPLVPAALLWLFGPQSYAADVALQIWSLLQVGLVFLLAAYLFRLMGVGRAAILLALLLLSAVPVYFEQEMLDFRWWEGAAVTCLGLSSLILIVRMEGRADIGTTPLLGVAALLGITAFVSPPVALGSGACWAYFALRRLNWAQRGTLMVGTAAVMAVLITPWAIRNQEVMGSPVLLRSNAGLELALANHPDALSDRPAREIFVTRFKAIHPYNNMSVGKAIRDAGGEVVYFRKLGAEAAQWIRAHPGEFLQLTWRHATQFFAPQAWQLSFGTWEENRSLRAGWIGLVNILGLIALGCGLWQRRRYFAYLALYIGGVALPYMVVQPVPRYTYLVYIPLMFLAADGLVRAITALRNHARRSARKM